MHILTKLTLASLACSSTIACATQVNDAWVGSGIASASIDAASLVRDSINTRLNQASQLKRSDGGAVWLDLNGKTQKNDTLMHGQGIKAKTYTANLGADIKTGETLFGVVYTGGRTDVETHHSAISLDGQSDFYGVKLYAEHAFGAIRINGASGWMHQHGHVQRAPNKSSCSMRSDIWTIDLGLSSDFTLGNTIVSPYIQAQTTLLLPNDWRSGQADDATIYSFPAGVRVLSTFEFSGYQVQPMIDVSVISNTGDTDARWIIDDHPHFTTFINDTIGRIALGLDVKGEKGSLGMSYHFAGSDAQYREHAILLRSSYTF